MSDRQLRDEIVTLFVAGHETTATALAWALYFLGRDPPLYAAVEGEARALGRTPSTDDLARLPLADRVFKESLRICPPVPVYERQALERVEVAGHVLHAGDYAAVFPWALHHRESLFPEPTRFDPSRFLPEQEEARTRHAYIPFGVGPRVCIGNHFALIEGPLVLATLLQEIRFTRVSEVTVRADPLAATMRPLGRVEMRVERG
jgi:cytochrome P450